MRFLVTTCFLSLAGAALAAAPPAPDAGHRVVFEVTTDSPDAWQAILNNVDNLKIALGDKTQVRVVAHGKGLGLLLATNVALKERMQNASARGVIFAACENTMKKQNVKKEQLLPFATTVDSGIAEVVRKQGEGWAYIKAG